MKTVTIYKTAIFKIHNPSRRKAAAMRDALLRNHRAYSKVLDNLAPGVEAFRSQPAGLKRDRAIQKAAWPIVRPLPLPSSAKAGVCADVAGQISSYLELSADPDRTVSFPTAARLSIEANEFEQAVDRLGRAIDLDEFEAAAAEMARERHRIATSKRPMLFLKNRVQDGFLLVRDPESKRLMAYLNLFASDNRFCRPVHFGQLIDVRTGEPVANQRRTTKTGLLLPLAFGRDFHEREFLEKGRPQSAKLLERDGVFELHVSFAFEREIAETDTMMGVDRGIYNLASAAIVDDDHRELAAENFDGRKLRSVQRRAEKAQKLAQKRGRKKSMRRRRRAEALQAVHRTANRIVELAQEHGSQVVMENLAQISVAKKKKTGKSNFRRSWNRRQYEKLRQILDYKLPLAGLPRPRFVAAAYTSQTCGECGHVSRDNRISEACGDGFKRDVMRCQACGHGADADLNAARVIALKKMWRLALPASLQKKTKGEIPDEFSFENFMKWGASGRQASSSMRPGLDRGWTNPRDCASSLDLDQTLPRKKLSRAKPLERSSSNENPQFDSQDVVPDQLLTPASGLVTG